MQIAEGSSSWPTIKIMIRNMRTRCSDQFNWIGSLDDILRLESVVVGDYWRSLISANYVITTLCAVWLLLWDNIYVFIPGGTWRAQILALKRGAGRRRWGKKQSDGCCSPALCRADGSAAPWVLHLVCPRPHNKYKYIFIPICKII